MAYPAIQLVTEALYTSGLVSADLETPLGTYVTTAFSLLNDVLAVKTANLDLISFFQPYTTDTVVGQETYFVPNLLYAETVTFNLANSSPVRFALNKDNRNRYQGEGRIDNLQTLPYKWESERAQGGMNINLYPLPSDVFLIRVFGKFGLQSVPSLQFDLQTVYEQVYIVYLRYALAEYICTYFTLSMPPGAAKQLEELKSIIHSISPPDLTLSKLSTFQRKMRGDIYLQGNLALGWSS